MYESYFQLKGRPFMKTPDPAYLFPSRQHEEALARLQLAVSEREVAVLAGQIGCGKTLLTRALVDSLGEEADPVLIINPNVSAFQLLMQIARGLGLEEGHRRRRDVVDAIQTRLFEKFEQGRLPVIIIDEAQLIPAKEVFDELRLLTNFQLDDQNLFALILVGQPELLKRLKGRGYTAFRQRVGVLFKLGPLSLEETHEYILHRLRKAGGRANLFSPQAIAAIHAGSEGVPRVINHLATNALMEGMGREAGQISAEIIEDVIKDLAFEMA